LSNVLLAGEATVKAQLHRPQARTAATVRVSLFPELPLFCLNVLPVNQLGNRKRIPARVTPSRNADHR
jgi:hypothetical protein